MKTAAQGAHEEGLALRTGGTRRPEASPPRPTASGPLPRIPGAPALPRSPRTVADGTTGRRRHDAEPPPAHRLPERHGRTPARYRRTTRHDPVLLARHGIPGRRTRRRPAAVCDPPVFVSAQRPTAGSPRVDARTAGILASRPATGRARPRFPEQEETDV
ncbi:hypothetical protein PV682_15825 [Streptomyces niveiscabiei]|uniref:hypothetical protein n=1 Tax=Streptomyces niveiscabiei TaxID=164115 RepID=UPI0029B32A20|nr:hypothetical protein [Streptomyces niveiscabiei]MDX3382926.1 hypothetical protein [Streptomyces niveiscabiei]